MKRCLKKILLILIIFIIVFEFTFSNTVNAASVINEETLNAITNLAGGIVSIVLWIPRILIIGFAFVMNLIIHGVAISEGKIPDSSSFSDGVYVTPFHIFFNQYAILDINFFDISGLDTDSFLYKFRTAVAFWFYVLRLISSVILLCILIYVGIRMAISSVAEDKAKYKKMLFDWACSLALIFILQYLAIGLIYLNDAIVGALGAMTSSEDIDKISEDTIQNKEPEDGKTAADQTKEEQNQTTKLDELQKKYDDLNQQYIRLAADFDNFRKRQEQERENLLKFGTENALKKLIEVLDNFERGKKALESVEDCQQVKDSFDLIHKQTIETLTKLGMEAIETEGQTFDPNFHEAVMRTPTSDYPEHTIINELQKGYKVGEKVLRPALVNVATEA